MNKQKTLPANWGGGGRVSSGKVDLGKPTINIVLHVERIESQESLGDVQIKLA